jgi:serine/threonine protein phosphatase PrpC
LAQTRDHSLFESMIAAGLANEERRRQNPERNVLTASLGSDDAFEPEVLAQPLPLVDGDAFLLCTDGLWDHVTEPQMEGSLQRSTSPRAWVDDLAAQVSDRARPGHDNYTALAVWLGEAEFVTRLIKPASDATPTP